MTNLPSNVQDHIDAYLRTHNLDDVARIIDNPCGGCPSEGAITAAEPLDIVPPCYNCPLWALQVDIAQLRLRRKIAGQL